MLLEDLLFFGGFALMGGSLLLLLILIPVFRMQRKRLISRIENGKE